MSQQDQGGVGEFQGLGLLSCEVTIAKCFWNVNLAKDRLKETNPIRMQGDGFGALCCRLARCVLHECLEPKAKEGLHRGERARAGPTRECRQEQTSRGVRTSRNPDDAEHLDVTCRMR